MIRLILPLFLLFFSAFSYAKTEQINVYDWSDYLPDEILQKFQKETGIKVNYSSYDSNETLYAKLKANPESGYDVIGPSSYFIERMRKQNMLAALDKAKLSNFKYLNSTFLNKSYDPDNLYSIPYIWSATGIVVNKKYHTPQSVKSWSDLWRPEYKNQLLLVDDPREVLGISLITLGYSPNETNPDAIKKAHEKLKSLMPNVKLFNSEAEEAIYIDEDVTLGMGWTGDIFIASRENPNLEFIYPQEGFIISVDSLAIPMTAPHKNNALKFINFLMRPDIAKAITLKLGFPTANSSAMQYLPKEYKQSPIINPNPETLKRGIFLNDVGSASTLYEKYLELLKIDS